MFDRAQLRERLGELVRERRGRVAEIVAEATVHATDVAGLGTARSASHQQGIGVEAYLPGGEWNNDRGAVFVHECLRSEVEKPRCQWGRLGSPPPEEEDLAALSVLGLERALFLDLETGGFASSPVFLAGTMHWNGSDFVMRQYFARHYGEEATLLSALHEAAKDFEFLVTFNGKSYDAPFLVSRAYV